MIYIFDNITNREKVSFSNALRTVNKIPAAYINYYTPVRDLININQDTLGMCILGGDEFLNTTGLSDTSFDDSFNRDLKEKFDSFKQKLKDIVNAKLERVSQLDVIVDGILDKDMIKNIKSSRDVTIVKGTLAKSESLFNDKDILEKNVFEIDIDPKADISSLENSFKEYLSKLEAKVINVEIIDLKAAA